MRVCAAIAGVVVRSARRGVVVGEALPHCRWDDCEAEIRPAGVLPGEGGNLTWGSERGRRGGGGCERRLERRKLRE